MQNIAVRFYWDGHRGILCIKNEFAQHKKMQIRIQPQYEKQIIFEEYPNKKYVTEDCKSQKHIYVYFLRRKDREIGRFYKISVFN